MKWLTEDAILLCTHQLGNIKNRPTQGLVTVNGRRVLVDNDPELRHVSRCPNIGITIKPCQTTLKVVVGYSGLLKVDGKSVCLDSVRGFTDGTPPGIVQYEVRSAGQQLVGSTQ